MTRARRRLWQATTGALLAFTLALPLAAAEPAAPVSQHGGGGFALLLLDYRQGLERLIVALRQGTAELAEGVAMAPAEMMGAWHRVTAGKDPLLLAAALAGILGAGFLARHAVRRRVAGARVDRSYGAADGFGSRLARACYRFLVDLLGLGAFALVTLLLAAIVAPAPGPEPSLVLSYVTAGLVALGTALAARFLLAPDETRARLLPVGESAARFPFRWLVTLAAVGSVAWLSAALLILSGMALAAHLVLALAVGTLIAALLAAIVVAGPWSRRRCSAPIRPRHRPCAYASPAPGTASRCSTSA